MSDFHPQTDLPERVEDDDAPVSSTSRLRDEATQRRRKRWMQLTVLAITLVLLAMRLPIWRVLVAMGLMYVTLMIGVAVLGAFARPIPEPPPPGELRRVKLVYRCSSCGAELRMTLASEEMPQPPRHCADEMDLLTPVDEL